MRPADKPYGPLLDKPYGPLLDKPYGLVPEDDDWFWLALCWSLSCLAPGGVVLPDIAPLLVVLLPEPLPLIEDWESAGAVPMVEEEELAEGGVGALCASGLVVPEGDGAGALIEVVVGGSVLSALLQAVRATAASTGAKMTANFMMCPFSEGYVVMSLCSLMTDKGNHVRFPC